MIELRPLLAVTAVAALVLPAGASAATRTKDISPYKTFKFQYTSSRPDSRTGFSYHVALDLPSDGSQPPVIQELRLRFAKGTRIDLGAVPRCTADDVSLGAQGPSACPTKARIATGSAGVWTGPGPLLDLTMNVFATGPRGIVATLDSNGNLLRVLRGTLRRTQLTVRCLRSPWAAGRRRCRRSTWPSAAARPDGPRSQRRRRARGAAGR